MDMGPENDQPAEVLTFRCPVDLLDWVRGFVKKGTRKKGGVTLSRAAAWAIGQGREHYEVINTMRVRIDAAAKAERLTRGLMMERLLEAGLVAYERDKKTRK